MVVAVTVIGRDPDVDIVLEDPGTRAGTPRSASLHGRATIVDLGSTNGTFVDGERVTRATELTDGSIITVGRTRITFHAGNG